MCLWEWSGKGDSFAGGNINWYDRSEGNLAVSIKFLKGCNLSTQDVKCGICTEKKYSSHMLKT